MGSHGTMTLSLLRSRRLCAFLFASILTVLKVTLDRFNVTTWRVQEEWFDKSLMLSSSTSSPLLLSIQHYCAESLRCKSLSMDRKFSFIHISKTGGASWIEELKRLVHSNLFPQNEAGVEHSVSFQNSLDPFDFLSHHLISLRSPRHHLWSLFSQCKYGAWGLIWTNGTDFPRHGTTPEADVHDFRIWLNHFLDVSTKTKPVNKADGFKCYQASNYQANAMTSAHWNPGHSNDLNYTTEPDFGRSVLVYESMDWVALTDFFHESKCLLYYRLEPKTERINDYIERMCRCPPLRLQRRLKATTLVNGVLSINNETIDEAATPVSQPSIAAQEQPIERIVNENPPAMQQLDTIKITPQTTRLQHVNKNGDVHTTHHDSGCRRTMADLPLDILNSVNALTHVDQKLYKLALERFFREMSWLEMRLGRRVLCDQVLNRWDPELAYLNVSVTAMYHTQ
jgi:hypothetical protein